MFRRSAFSLVLALIAVSATAQPAFEKYWEKMCGVDSTANNVRTMAVWDSGNVLATINRGAAANAIKLYNLQSGQPWIRQETVKMSGDAASIPVGTYNIVDGDFTDDGKLIVCNLAHTSPMSLKVYI